MKDKLLQIIQFYGVLPQLKYFQSEVFELNEAIITFENEYPDCNIVDDKRYIEAIKNNIAQEIADCYVMLEQFRLYYNISKDEIKEIMEYKIDRQINRIKYEEEKNNERITEDNVRKEN